MFSKKTGATNFERAVWAYYKCCYRKGVIPTKPFELYSEIGSGYVFLKNRFGVIAKTFFVENDSALPEQKTDYAPRDLVFNLR
jgi:hypothetical protein